MKNFYHIFIVITTMLLLTILITSCVLVDDTSKKETNNNEKSVGFSTHASLMHKRIIFRLSLRPSFHPRR